MTSHGPAMSGRKPKDIAPLIYEAPLRKIWKVWEGIKDNAWILKIRPDTVVSSGGVRKCGLGGPSAVKVG